MLLSKSSGTNVSRNRPKQIFRGGGAYVMVGFQGIGAYSLVPSSGYLAVSLNLYSIYSGCFSTFECIVNLKSAST
jgi:hypothetical protein